MSVQRALDHINFLIDVLEEADKQAGSGSTQQQSSISGVNGQNVKYFGSTDDCKEGITVRVTTDINRLQKEWEECGLGHHSELKAFLGQVGKVTEIEEDDETIQLRWENYDTCWMPVRVLSDANGAKETLPGMANSWLGDSTNTQAPKQEEEKQQSSQQAGQQSTGKIEPESLFESVEDDGVKEGNVVQVTRDLKILQKTWKECELGENDTMNVYLGTIGKITEIEEDDDTVQLQWGNFDTVWIPVKACQDAKGAKPTLPGATVSWLS